MKLVFSILLLLITAVYILPVKRAVSGHMVTCVQETDGDKTDNDKGENKKEKPKDFTSTRNIFSSSNLLTVPEDRFLSINALQLLHQVEAPPPDLI